MRVEPRDALALNVNDTGPHQERVTGQHCQRTSTTRIFQASKLRRFKY